MSATSTPSTQYSQVQLGTTPYSPVQPSTAQYSPVQPSLANYSPLQQWQWQWQWKRKRPDAEAQIPKQGEVDVWPQKIFENKRSIKKIHCSEQKETRKMSKYMNKNIDLQKTQIKTKNE